MNKVYFVDKNLIQKRAYTLTVTSTKVKVKDYFLKNLLTYFSFTILFIFVICVFVFANINDFLVNGAHKNGGFSEPNLISGEFNKNGVEHLLGTDSLGRDNWELFLVSWENLFIYLASFIFVGIILSIIIVLIFQNFKTNKITTFFKNLRRYEGLFFLPILLTFLAIFIDNNYYVFVITSSVPFACTLAYEVLLRKNDLVQHNYKQIAFNGILGFRNSIFYVNISIFVRSILFVLPKSLLFIIFWKIQFSYIGVFSTFDSYLIGLKNTVGSIIYNSTSKILSNPQFAIATSLSAILFLSIFSIIYPNFQKKFKKSGVKNDLY